MRLSIQYNNNYNYNEIKCKKMELALSRRDNLQLMLMHKYLVTHLFLTKLAAAVVTFIGRCAFPGIHTVILHTGKPPG